MVVYVEGVRKSAGVFEGVSFDKIQLHCVFPPDKNTICGKLVDIVKIPTPLATTICDRLGVAFGDLEGKNIRLYYNKYGNVDDFELVEKKN